MTARRRAEQESQPLVLDEKTSAQPRSRVGSPHCEAACARSGLAHANATRPKSKSGPAHANALQPALPRPCMQKQTAVTMQPYMNMKIHARLWGGGSARASLLRLQQTHSEFILLSVCLVQERKSHNVHAPCKDFRKKSNACMS